jgi:hypothetical protein
MDDVMTTLLIEGILVHDLRTLTVPFNAGSTSSAWKEGNKRAERKRKYPENYWVALNHWESGNTLKVEMLALSMLDVITEIIMQMWCSQEKKAARWINKCAGKYDYFQKQTKSSM